MTVDVKPGSEHRRDLRRPSSGDVTRHQVVAYRLRRTVTAAGLTCILVEQRGSRKRGPPIPSARRPGPPFVAIASRRGPIEEILSTIRRGPGLRPAVDQRWGGTRVAPALDHRAGSTARPHAAAHRVRRRRGALITGHSSGAGVPWVRRLQSPGRRRSPSAADRTRGVRRTVVVGPGARGTWTRPRRPGDGHRPFPADGTGAVVRARPGARPLAHRTVPALVVDPILPDLDGLFTERRRVLRLPGPRRAHRRAVHSRPPARRSDRRAAGGLARSGPCRPAGSGCVAPAVTLSRA